MAKFSERLRELRKERGLKQREMAEILSLIHISRPPGHLEHAPDPSGLEASPRMCIRDRSRMTDRFNELLTEYYFCSLDYMRSPASCTQEYVRYSSVCGQAESDYLSAVQEVLNRCV